jgi:hypothetical protein
MAFLFTLSSCGNETITVVDEKVNFGKKITTDGAISLTDAIKKIKLGEGATDLDLGEGHIVQVIPIKIEGKVSAVCKMAGCWLDIESEGQTITITTNDEFFVKPNIVEKTVIVEGNAYEAITTVAELKSAAKELGESPENIENITAPKSEYKFLAKGLFIKNKK